MSDRAKNLIRFLERFVADHEADATHLRQQAEEAVNNNREIRRYVAIFNYQIVNHDPVIDGFFDNDREALVSLSRENRKNDNIYARNDESEDLELIINGQIHNVLYHGIYDLELDTWSDN